MNKDIHSLKARELEVVLKISQAVSRTLDLREILKMACQMTAQELNADRCSIGLLDTKGTYTITHSSYRRRATYPSIAGERFIASHYPVIARKLSERKVIQIIRDKPSSFLSMNERRLLKQLNMKVFLAVPIVLEEKPIGAFHLAKVENSSPFSFSDISLCRTIASQIGIAIKNATLVMELRKNHELLEKQSEDLKSRYEQQNLVLDISRYLFRAASLQELYDVITQKTCQALGLDRCTILQFDSKQKEAVLRSIYHSSGQASRRAARSSHLGEQLPLEPAPEIFRPLLKKGFLTAEDIQLNPLLPKARKYVKTLGVKSALVIPFFWGRKISGSIQLSTIKDYHHFTDSEIKFCQTIANLASMSLQNVKLMQNLKEKSVTLQQQAEVLGKQYREQTILLEISKALSQTLDTKKLFDIIAHRATDLLGVERCAVVLVDQIKGETIFSKEYVKGKHQPQYGSVQEYTKDFPVLYNLTKKKQVFSTSDISRSNLTLQEKSLFRKEEIRSFLLVPFPMSDNVFGVLALSSPKAGHWFDESEIKMIQAIASQFSVAIENARLVQDLQNKSRKIQTQTEALSEQFREQSILLEISKALSETLNSNTLFAIVSRKSVELLRVDRCTIMLFDQSSDSTIIHKVFAKGRHRPQYEGLRRTRQDYPVLSKHILKEPHLFYAYDLSRSVLSPKEKRLLGSEGMKSLLAIPFYFAKTNLGIMAFSTLQRLHRFTESEIRLGQAIANQLSVAVENARLMQDLREKNIKIKKQTEVLEKQFNEQRILLEISKALSQTLDLKNLLKIVTRKTVELLGIDRTTAMIIDQKTGDFPLFTHFSRVKQPGELKIFPKSVRDFPYIIDQVRNGQIFCFPDISKSTLTSKEKSYFRKRGIKSVLSIPFILRGRLLGVLGLNSIREKHEFTEPEIRLSRAIANQLSVAVENTRLMQDLQEKSLRIQEQGKTLEKQFNEQRILLEVSKALSQTLDLKELFKIVTQKTVELLGIDRAVAMIIDQKTGNHSLFVHYSRIKDIPELSDFPKNINEFPYLIEKSRTGRVYSVFDTEKSGISSREKKYFRKRKIKSVLVVPFVLKGKLLGVLSLNNIKEKRVFTDSEIKLTQAIANQLSMAVENANLMEISKKHSKELEKLSLQIINAQEEERKNLAGRLHDVVGQDLTALQLDLKMSRQEIPEQFTQTRARLEEEERLARQALENVRNLTLDLRPPILDDFGLASAIRWYVDSFSRRTDIKVILKLQKRECELTPEFETAVYRAIQECLTNVAKHSGANRVNLLLDKQNEYLRIVIRDNGIGFNPEIFRFTSGFGLFRLKENTELLGGKFRISSKKGKGTRVVITFPCKDKEKK